MTEVSTTLSRSLLRDARARLEKGLVEEAREILEPFSPTGQTPPGESSLLFWRDAAETLRNAGMADASIAAWSSARDAGLDPVVAEMESAVARLVAGRFDPQPLLHLAESRPRNAVIRNLAALAVFESGEWRAALDQWDSCRWFSTHKKCPLSTEPVHLSLGAMALERFFLENPPPPEPLRTASPERVSRDLWCRLPSLPEEAGVGEEKQAGKPAPQISRDSHAPERAPGRTRQGRLARIGQAYDKRDFDTALRWLDAELALPGDKPSELNLLRAFILAEKNRWPEAREETARALEARAAPPIAESFLACCLTRSGEPHAALAILENVQPAGPDDYFRHYFQGGAYLALGDRVRALHAFLRAFRHYFYDNYHEILVPAWERMIRIVRP